MSDARSSHAPTPWAEWMMIAFGYLGYNRRDWYDLSVGEWEQAIKGCIKKNGGKIDSDFMSYEELNNLMEQFPDE